MIGVFKGVTMEEELKELLGDLKAGRVTRRDFVQRGLAAGMTVSALGLLLHNTPVARAAAARQASGARKGGTLRVTIQGPSTGTRSRDHHRYRDHQYYA